MPMPVISRTSSDSSTVFSVTSATRVCKFGLVPHVWAAAPVPPISGRFVQRWRAAAVQSAVEKTFFHQLFPVAFSISCWEKKGIKVRKSQCLWRRFTLTPHLCSTWKNLTPESLHILNGVVLQQLWIADVSYWILQKPLLLHHIWFCTLQMMALPLKERGEKKTRKE